MAEKKIIYDFETVLSILVKSQEDLIELVTKWSEMLDTTPRYVEFNLSGRDQPLVVPNIQMVIDTLNERSVPDDLHIHSVVASTVGGAGEFNAAHVKFEGSGHYSATKAFVKDGATNSDPLTPFRRKGLRSDWPWSKGHCHLRTKWLHPLLNARRSPLSVLVLQLVLRRSVEVRCPLTSKVLHRDLSDEATGAGVLHFSITEA